MQERGGKMRWIFVIGLVACCVGLAVAEAMPPLVGAGPGKTLNDIVGTPTLVTIVLRETEAMQKNLCVTVIHDGHLEVIGEDNSDGYFPFSMVKEVIVQGGKVEEKVFKVEDERSLRPDEQKVVDRAYARAGELYAQENVDQAVRMRAALLLSLTGDQETHKYIEQLAQSNDPLTALEATSCLYLAGKTTPNKQLVSKALRSGNRRVRVKAIVLAGLFEDHSDEGYLAVKMLQDRSAEYAAPAARALARLGNRDCIPTLLRLLTGRSPEKAEAAVFALSLLGGRDVATQMKIKYENAVGESRFRIAKVLYNLNDPRGRELLADEFLQVQTLAREAAVLLAEDGHEEAMGYLRIFLNRRFNEDEGALKVRTDAAAGLIAGGNMSPISILQEMLRSDNRRIQAYVCQKVVDIGDRRLLTITQPAIESSRPGLALDACTAAVALSDPDGFRDRLIALEG